MNFVEWLIAMLTEDYDGPIADDGAAGADDTAEPDEGVGFDSIEPDEETGPAGIWGVIAGGTEGLNDATRTLTKGKCTFLKEGEYIPPDWVGEGVDLAIPTVGPYTNGKQEVSVYGQFWKIKETAVKIKYLDCRLSALIKYGECHPTSNCHGPPHYYGRLQKSDPEQCHSVNGIAKVEALYPFDRALGEAIGGKWYKPEMGEKPVYEMGSEKFAIMGTVGYAEIDEGTFQLASLKTGHYLVTLDLQSWPGRHVTIEGNDYLVWPHAIGPGGTIVYRNFNAKNWATRVVVVYENKPGQKMLWYYDYLSEKQGSKVQKCYGL